MARKKFDVAGVMFISSLVLLSFFFVFCSTAQADGYAQGVICDIQNSPDSDSDGLCDYNEVYIYGTNPYIKSTDGDRYDDRQEIFGSSTKNGDMPHYVVVP